MRGSLVTRRLAAHPCFPNDLPRNWGHAVYGRGQEDGEFLGSGEAGRSRRLTVSPMDRQNAVRAEGPPMQAKRALAQVLSLNSTAPSHMSATDIAPLPKCCLATGAYSSRSSGP